MPGGDGREPRRRRASYPAVVTIAMGLVLVANASALAQSCQPPTTIDLITGASASSVVGVVEYEVIATNSAGFGTAVGATKRIWGGAMADRWMVVAAEPECPETPVSGIGERFYVLVGAQGASGDTVFGVPASGQLSGLEEGALASIVGEPVSIGSGSLDRMMAWMRVNWWLLGAGLALVVATAAVVRHRSVVKRRDYLF